MTVSMPGGGCAASLATRPMPSWSAMALFGDGLEI